MELTIRQKKIVNAKENRIFCLSGAGTGKCIPNSVEIPTPDGNKKVEEIKVGDYLFDRLGNPTKVLGVYPQGEKEVYEITFEDGRKVKCSKDHIWTYYKTSDRNQMHSKTLEEILNEIVTNPKQYKNESEEYIYHIPLIEKAKYIEKQYSLPPYILGLFLGRGIFREDGIIFLSSDDFLPKKIASIMNWNYYNDETDSRCWFFVCKNKKNVFYKIRTFNFLDKNLDFANQKFIPKNYLIGSIEQRMDLLRGVLDSSGYIGKNNEIYCTATNEQLCKGILSLVYSLGFKGKYFSKNKIYYISIQCNNQDKVKLFSVSNKLQDAKNLLNNTDSFSKTNPIIKIEKLNYKEEMTCFYVDNKEHLFAMNDWCITHNTTVLTERVRRLINDGCNPEGIVAITYTNLAAEEMKKRLGSICEGAFIGTFHSYANHICISNGIDTSEDILAQNFDKLIYKTLYLTDIIYPKVEHLLIDEFQDIYKLEYDFMKKIPAKNIFIIGDDRQMIYSFNGSSMQYFETLYYNQLYTKYYLTENYRCPNNIIDYANKKLYPIRSLSLPCESAKKNNGYINECTFMEALEELEWSADWGNWSIICRTNNEVSKIIEILNKKEIPNVAFKKSDFDFIELNSALAEDKVKILTIHSMKGLQNKNIIAVGAKFFNDEEKRIAYVAATRAEESLYWCPSVIGRGERKKNSTRSKTESYFGKANTQTISFL